MSSLTPQQLQAVSLLALGKTHAEIADKLGISTKTMQRWTKMLDFAQAVADVQSRATEFVVESTAVDIVGQIQKLVPKAISTLEQYLDDSTAKGSDRLRAAQILGNWAGLNQVPFSKTTEQPAEQNLKDYLSYLASNKNGNSSSASNH